MLSGKMSGKLSGKVSVCFLNVDLKDIEKWQLSWYLELYGFETEEAFGKYLSTKNVILDAGCGLGYKAAWFAKLNPKATVI